MPSQKPARTTVFISYSHKDQRWLERLQINLKGLEHLGPIDRWDDTKINSGSDWREEIRKAIESAKVAVLLISADFLASDFIAKNELPPLLAAAQTEGLIILPVIVSHSLFQEIETLSKFQTVNPPSKPLSGMTRVKQEALLVKLSRDILSILKDETPSVITAVPASDKDSARPDLTSGKRELKEDQIRNIFLSYDWEDRPEVRELVKILRDQGVKITWDQDWPHYSDFDKEISRAISNADTVIFYSTSHSYPNDWMSEEIKIAKKENKKIVVLDRNPGQRDDQLQNEQEINIVGFSIKEAAQAVIGKLQPLLNTDERIELEIAQKNVRDLLKESLKANHGIPSDTLTDKIFFSPEACRLVEIAHGKALHLPDNNPDRLQAILEYGRMKRFRGEWDIADRELRQARNSSRKNEKLYPMFCLEVGAIQFELGFIDDGIALVSEALTRIPKRKVSTILVKAMRQLGNMLWEQGDGEEAGQYLSTATSFVGYLEFTADSEETSTVAADILRIDCIRERASFLLKQHKFKEGYELFRKALKDLEDENLLAAGEYLKGTINYHLGRAYLLYDRDVGKALEHLKTSRNILRKYDNPVRLAFVYDYIGRALAEQHLASNLEEALIYLEKARRIRQRCNHRYMVADTEIGIGNLYLKLNKINEAIKSFKHAQEGHNRLSKPGPEGNASFALAMACLKAADSEKTDAGVGRFREEARTNLNLAKERFHSVDLEEREREVEFELLKLGKLGDTRILWSDPDDLLTLDKKDILTLNVIGEYDFHKWIKKKFGGRTELQLADIPVGIGDDAAVIQITDSEIYDLVLTTDAAPGSISRKTGIKDGIYAAKFSVVHSLSDVLAMGATPIAVLLNLYLNRDAKLEYAMKVVETVYKEARNYGAFLVGGDLKERNEQSIGCVGIGVVEKGRAIKRNGAMPGQIVAITLAGKTNGAGFRKIGCRWAQEVIEDYRLAEDKRFRDLYRDNWKDDLLFLPYKVMIAGARTNLIKSAIDTSDGVLACLQLLGQESGVGFVLEEENIEKIIDENVKKIAEELVVRPSQFLFNAGHDWEIVLTVEEDDFDSLRKTMQAEGGDLARLGTVCPINHNLKNGVAFVLKKTGNEETGKKVWVPFFTDEKFVRRPYEDRALDWDDLRFYLDGRRELK